MQLTVREVSEFLNVPQSTVTRWIKQRDLPAHHVNGQFRFNRAELLEWATANQIKVSLEMFSHLDTADEPLPNLAMALEAGGINYGLKGANKSQVLQSLVQVLPLPAGVDRGLILGLFVAREAAASTGIGGGIALPHVRNPIVLHVDLPKLTLCFLERPIDFGALDGQPVHVLFTMICPTMRSHLQTISRLSYALHDPKLREVVLRQAERGEVLREVERVEAALGIPAGAAGKAAQ